MTNRVKFGWVTGETLTFTVSIADGTATRGAADQSLPESGVVDGYYTAVPSTEMQVGDTVIVENAAGRQVGFGENLPGVDCVTIEGDDFTDTLIGADGDTLESLSDELDIILASGSRVLNRYPTRSQPDV